MSLDNFTENTPNNTCHQKFKAKKFSPSRSIYGFKHGICLLSAGSIILLSSCGSPQIVKVLEPNPKLFTAQAYTEANPAPRISGQVSRPQAIRHALTYNPTLLSLRAELRAMEAEVIQASLSPNPEFEVEAENFGGNGSRSSFNSAEITAGISQQLELGGKRKKRTLVAALGAKWLRAEIQSKEREIETRANNVFTSILEAKQLRKISEQNVARANEQLQAITALMEAGTSTRIDVNKAKLAVSKAKESLSNARNLEASEVAKLNGIWGVTASSMTLSGSLTPKGLSSLPTDPGSAIANHPAMRAARLKYAQRQAAHELAKAHRISDVKFGAGVRDDREANDTLGVLRLSIPLPITNQNQGNIRAAKERIDQASAEGHAKASELRTRFIQRRADLRNAQSRLTEIDSQTVRAARQSLDDTQKAYSEGKRSLLEYLDARQTLFEIEKRRIRAQADLKRAENALRILSRN